MKNPLNLEDRHWQIVKQILITYPYQFYAFGSRARNQAKALSDLDLCYKEPIPDYVVSQIEEAFEESDLPFRVEVINWNQCDPTFQQSIEKDLLLLDFA